MSTSPLMAALIAEGPAVDRADRMKLYAFLVGDWEAEALLHRPDGRHKLRCEIHAGWVLAGRAIQDVWIIPGLFHGTTLRLYDPKLDAWHIHWLDPVMQSYPRMIGRAVGADIVQEGQGEEGSLMRWSFRDITPDAFRWTAEVSVDGGASWQTQLEIWPRRIAQPSRASS